MRFGFVLNSPCRLVSSLGSIHFPFSYKAKVTYWSYAKGLGRTVSWKYRRGIGASAVAAFPPLSLSLSLSTFPPPFRFWRKKLESGPSVRPSASVCTHKREEGGREQSTAEERERERVVVSGHATKELTFYLRAQKGIGCSFS